MTTLALVNIRDTKARSGAKRYVYESHSLCTLTKKEKLRRTLMVKKVREISDTQLRDALESKVRGSFPAAGACFGGAAKGPHRRGRFFDPPGQPQGDHNGTTTEPQRTP